MHLRSIPQSKISCFFANIVDMFTAEIISQWIFKLSSPFLIFAQICFRVRQQAYPKTHLRLDVGLLHTSLFWFFMLRKIESNRAAQKALFRFFFWCLYVLICIKIRKAIGIKPQKSRFTKFVVDGQSCTSHRLGYKPIRTILACRRRANSDNSFLYSAAAYGRLGRGLPPTYRLSRCPAAVAVRQCTPYG